MADDCYLDALVGESATLRRSFFERRNVQAGNRHTAAVIQPHHNSASLWVHRRMLRTRDRVAISTTRQDKERLKRPRGQQLANVRDHCRNLSAPRSLRKSLKRPSAELTHARPKDANREADATAILRWVQ